jgi:hypothetical protein
MRGAMGRGKVGAGPPQADFDPSGGSDNGRKAAAVRLTSRSEVKARSAGRNQRSERGG